MNREALQAWLDPLDPAPVECDGMTRTISMLLTANDIEHAVYVGILFDSLRLEDSGVGMDEEVGVLHYWIELQGHIIDYRARMWLGKDAPHGVFPRDDNARFRYHHHEANPFKPVPVRVLSIVTKMDLGQYPGYEQ